jgi:hypothetical protein
MQELRQKLGMGQGRGGQGRGGDQAGGGDASGRGRGGDAASGPGGGNFGGGRGGRGGMDPLAMFGGRRTPGSQFTEEERKNAVLPLPPEQDSQVQALLRPGLLADVEIIVEKIPNALHIPAQAVFDKNNKPTVFVQKNGKFEAREIQLIKRSESMMVLSGGVQPGEVIAMADPTATDKKGKSEKKSQGGGMGMMPGSK